MINLRLSSLLDVRVVFAGQLVMLAVAVLAMTFMPAAGETSTTDAAAAVASAAFTQNLIVLSGIIIAPLVTIAVLVINRRSDAKAKEREVKAAADAKLAENNAMAAVRQAENSERRLEKAEERMRANEAAAEVRAVAAQTARAAELLVAQQAEIASKTAQAVVKADEVAATLKATTAAQVESAKSTAVKLEELSTGVKVVHTIVNSQRTEDIEAKLVLAESNMILLQDVAALKNKLGEATSDETKNRISAANATIKELRATLAAKKDADTKASAIIESDKAVAEAVIVAGPAPVLVTDERTAKGVEKIAEAMEKTADAAESRKPEGK